ncbi:semaphorin-4C [Erpetoichthys calabaricus]|uniref:semaphorin-4C n=1 Tax=Erpetoichthys calabaricus TaxID=27687 RepID=UPI0022343D75|nr:semaphorin-4C [Erpetoichthys calabaricus]
MGTACLLLMLAVLSGIFSETSLCLNWDPVPRKTILFNNLKDIKSFSKVGVFNYTTLTLDEGNKKLYVGAREAIFSLNMTDVSQNSKLIVWEAPPEKKAECIQKGKNNQSECFNYIRFLQRYNETHMYTCGTYAFQPKCSYISLENFTLEDLVLEDGKGKCPYDPAKGHTGLIVDKELYSATFNNFLGTEPVILRNLGQHRVMKTEYLPSWLNEPDFVASTFVEGNWGDDKIYFFFSERAVELDCDNEQVVARVAQVCKGDVGGARTLQKKWTSFLKARLLCSIPHQHVHFNKVQAVFALGNGQETIFFGIFQARWGDVDVSAVCRYNLADITKVFNGPFKEFRESAQKWGRYTGQIPTPRPGSCITKWHQENGFNSSLQLPDITLNFAKKHPLMDDQVSEQPLLVKKNVNFTQIAVDRVDTVSQGSYEVLFIGTAEGWLYKAVIVKSEVHIIEELQLFETIQPVESLKISHTEKVLYIGSRSGVIQLLLADCSKYSSFQDCTLARDPYCAWDREGRMCVQVDRHFSTLSLEQDILQNPRRVGEKFHQSLVPSSDKLKPKNVTVVAGSSLVLPCQIVSNLAQTQWLFNDHSLQLKNGLHFDRQLCSLVIEDVGPSEAGHYSCFSEEAGVKFMAERYQVSVVASVPVFMEARTQELNLGLVWVLVITLGAVCLLLLGAVLYLRRRLKEQLGKGAEMKPLESTLVYPISLPKEPRNFVPSKMADPEDKFWDPVNYYYSDGSLKIVPGHALCPNGSAASPTSNGIPGQPLPTGALHSPSRLSIGNIRGSGSNGYIRLNLGTEERGEFNEELRKSIKQRNVLPDANPEESSV